MATKKKRRNKKRKRSQRERSESARSDQAAIQQDFAFRRRASRNAQVLDRYFQGARNPDDVLDRATEDVETTVARLRERMAPWNAYDVLAWLHQMNLPRVEGYRESTHEGLLALVELAAIILLERSDPEGITGERDADDCLPPHPGVIADLCRDLDADLRGLLDAGMAISFARAHRDGAQDAYIRLRTVQRELLLRNPGYAHLEEQILSELFSTAEVKALVLGQLGFEIDDALAVVDAFSAAAGAAHEAGIQEAQRALSDFEASTDERVAQMRSRLGRHADQMYQAFGAATVMDALGQRTAIRVEDLADLASISRDRTEAVLALLSQPFGSSSAASVTDFLMGSNPMRPRSVMRDQDGRFYAIDCGNLLFGLREAIEGALKERGAFETYSGYRGKWVEDAAVTALAPLLRPDRIYRNLQYFTTDGVATEFDALMICDRVGVAVEAKSAALSARAKTGHGPRLKRDIERLVADTVQQAGRVREVVEQHDEMRIRGAAPLDVREVTRVFPIAVTLEDVSGICGTAAELIQAGMLEDDTRMPWMVSLQDLLVITEIAQGPAQLFGYLHRHEEVVSFKILAVSEELDVWMMFLQDGLYFGDYLDERGAPTTRMFVQSRTDPLDAYYLFKTGVSSTFAPKPRQRWSPKAFEDLIETLERDRPPGWSTACISLQQVDREVRKQLGAMSRRLARKSRRDGLPHDETRYFGDLRFPIFGITGMSVHPNEGIQVLQKRLDRLCRARKHLERATSWTGIGVCADRPGEIASIVQLDADWCPSDELDELVASLGMRPVAEVGSPPPEARRSHSR